MAASSVPTIKYFSAFGGRGLTAQLACRIGGIEYNFEGVNFPDWPTVKPSCPMGSLPTANIDGNTYCQSHALLRYFGRLGGLYPADPVAALKVDAVIATFIDLEGHWNRAAGLSGEEKVAARASLTVEGGASYDLLKKLDERLVPTLGGSNGFLVGGSVTIADIQNFAYFKNMEAGVIDGFPKNFLELLNAPNLRASYDAVAALPAVRAFYGEATAPTIEIKYFHFPGRNVPLLIACKLGKVEHTFTGLTGEQFGALKPTLPLGQVPIVTVNGVDIPQSAAQLTFLGKLAGIYPKCSISALKIDSVIGCIDDVANELGSVWGMKDAEEKKAAWAAVAAADSKFSKKVALLNAYIGTLGGSNGWMVGSSVSTADLSFFGTFGYLLKQDGFPATFLNDYPHLASSFGGVMGLAETQAVLAMFAPPSA